MDRCPPEILYKIFALACTDGGYTGSSLSLVSRHIHATSFPVRYHTVSLWGFPRMCMFQKTLAPMSSYPPAVHHLFISDGHVPVSGTEVLEEAASIISTLAPTLITLAGSLRPGITGVNSTSVIPHLPLLQDLSLCFTGPYSTSPDLSLPNLRRLHKWDTLYEQRNLADVNVITRVAPQLTEIRLSNVKQDCLHALQTVLNGEGAQDASGGPDVLQLPQTLKHFFIQGSLSWNWGHINTTVQEALERLLQEIEAEHKKVVLVPTCGYSIEECKKDWLEVIDGGDGCWRVSPRITT